MSKASDTVDHSLLLSKLMSYGASSATVQWLKFYLNGRSQCTAIGDVKFHPLQNTSGIPQGFIHGPKLFSIHINDLPAICPSNSTPVLFAVDTTIYVIGSLVPEISSVLSSSLKDCHTWMTSNKLKLNTSKTKCMLVHSSHHSVPPLEVALGQTHIEQVHSFQLLGYINEHLTLDYHIVHVSAKVTQNINLLWRLSWFLITFYNAYILQTFDYCDVVWQNCSQKASAQLERLQNYAGRVILKEPRATSAAWVKERLGWKTL